MELTTPRRALAQVLAVLFEKLHNLPLNQLLQSLRWQETNGHQTSRARSFLELSEMENVLNLTKSTLKERRLRLNQELRLATGTDLGGEKSFGTWPSSVPSR